MEIKRDRYLNKLISFMWDGQVKVITGIRRCGKSYLLRNLFRTYLLGEGVPADHILSFELDLTRDIRYQRVIPASSTFYAARPSIPRIISYHFAAVCRVTPAPLAMAR